MISFAFFDRKKKKLSGPSTRYVRERPTFCWWLNTKTVGNRRDRESTRISYVTRGDGRCRVVYIVTVPCTRYTVITTVGGTARFLIECSCHNNQGRRCDLRDSGRLTNPRPFSRDIDSDHIFFSYVLVDYSSRLDLFVRISSSLICAQISNFATDIVSFNNLYINRRL